LIASPVVTTEVVLDHPVIMLDMANHRLDTCSDFEELPGLMLFVVGGLLSPFRVVSKALIDHQLFQCPLVTLAYYNTNDFSDGDEWALIVNEIIFNKILFKSFPVYALG